MFGFQQDNNSLHDVYVASYRLIDTRFDMMRVQNIRDASLASKGLRCTTAAQGKREKNFFNAIVHQCVKTIDKNKLARNDSECHETTYAQGGQIRALIAGP